MHRQLSKLTCPITHLSGPVCEKGNKSFQLALPLCNLASFPRPIIGIPMGFEHSCYHLSGWTCSGNSASQMRALSSRSKRLPQYFCFLLPSCWRIRVLFLPLITKNDIFSRFLGSVCPDHLETGASFIVSLKAE